MLRKQSRGTCAKRGWPLYAALSEGGFASVGHLGPLPVRRGFGIVVVVPVPPLVGRGLGVSFGGVLPEFLASERGQVEETPGAAHGFVAAVVDEVSAENAVSVADEGVMAMPFVDAKVGVEAI